MNECSRRASVRQHVAAFRVDGLQRHSAFFRRRALSRNVNHARWTDKPENLAPATHAWLADMLAISSAIQLATGFLFVSHHALLPLPLRPFEFETTVRGGHGLTTSVRCVPWFKFITINCTKDHVSKPSHAAWLLQPSYDRLESIWCKKRLSCRSISSERVRLWKKSFQL